jgi:hypothetical protein
MKHLIMPGLPLIVLGVTLHDSQSSASRFAGYATAAIFSIGMVCVIIYLIIRILSIIHKHHHHE